MLGIGCGNATSEGGGQLALKDADSAGVRYLEGRVYHLLRGGRGYPSFDTRAAEFYRTVD